MISLPGFRPLFFGLLAAGARMAPLFSGLDGTILIRSRQR
jgi:hypothetical protein